MNAVKEKKTVALPKKRKIVSIEKKKARSGWLFVLPFVVGFILIYLPIIIDSIRYSFGELNAVDGTLKFVGLDNYRTALLTKVGDNYFTDVLGRGLLQMVIDIPSIVIFSLFIAIILNQKIIGRAAFRAIFFIPVILTTGLIAQIDNNNALLNYMNDSSGIDTGEEQSTTTQILSVMDLQVMFQNMAVGKGILTYVASAVNNIFDIVNRCGVQMLIFLAGLQSISPAIYESCQIDGASGWETFWKVTLPMVSPMILVNAIYTVIDAFTASSNTVMSYINNVYTGTGVAHGREISSAMSWTYFLVVILVIAVVAGLLSAFVFYQRRD